MSLFVIFGNKTARIVTSCRNPIRALFAALLYIFSHLIDASHKYRKSGLHINNRICKRSVAVNALLRY